jgi:cysteine-rich repeat protein
MRWSWVLMVAACTAHNPNASDDLAVPDDLASATDALDAAVDAAAPDLSAPNPCAGQPDGTSCGADHACRAGKCAPTTCGNHLVDPGEECDDANTVSGDGCEADCTYSCHGDADCDDGNPCDGAERCDSHICKSGAPLADGTACAGGVCRESLCAPATCGNKTLDPGEECDDGNLVAGDGCEANCRFSCHADGDCNDGNPCNGTERCDAHLCARGLPLADGAACTGGTCRARLCAPAGCGNGTLDPGEECDDNNRVAGDGCEANCLFSCHVDADCSDGNPCNGTETCGSNHVCATTAPLADGTLCGGGKICRGKLCALASCGDRIVEAPEECDDGNVVAGDGCENDCNFTCSLDRQCDDLDPCDGTETCASNHACAGGAPPPSGTLCDADANAATRDLCTDGTCHRSVCGDGFTDAFNGEQCDDHNLANMDGCNATCRIEQTQRLTGFSFLDGSQGCTDLDADAAIDNALGSGLNSAALNILNQYVVTGMNADPRKLIYFIGLDDLLGQNDASLRLGLIDGYVHLGGFTGMKGEAYDVKSTDLDATLLPRSILAPAAISGGGLSAGLGAAPMPLSVFGTTTNLVIRRAFGAVTSDTNIQRIDSIGSGIYCGTISAGELDRLAPPSEIHTACPKYNSMLDLFVGGCSFLTITVTATQPDIDVAKDGLGTLADTNNDGTVDRCTTGTGVIINGDNCAQDARFDDAYSFAASFAALRVQIVSIR